MSCGVLILICDLDRRKTLRQPYIGKALSLASHIQAKLGAAPSPLHVAPLFCELLTLGEVIGKAQKSQMCTKR